MTDDDRATVPAECGRNWLPGSKGTVPGPHRFAKLLLTRERDLDEVVIFYDEVVIFYCVHCLVQQRVRVLL